MRLRAALQNLCPGHSRAHAFQEIVLRFGKHRGKRIKQVDDGYLQWMQATLQSTQWRKLTSHILELRKKQQEAGTRTKLLHKLKACSRSGDLQKGKDIHQEAKKLETDSCIYISTALVNMYAKCGSTADARRVFDGLKHRDVILWNALILGYADNGEGLVALELFARMKSEGCTPDPFTFVAALKACACLAVDQEAGGREDCLERGKAIHSEIGSCTDNYVHNALIYMYAKCGSMGNAREVFEAMNPPDVVSWTALVLGYAENGEAATALDMFARMRSQGCTPDSMTFVAAIKACSYLALDRDGSGKEECLELGRRLHSEIGCRLNAYVQSTLIHMYASCGSMAEARQVFDAIKQPDLVSWNALILGYAEHGEADTVLKLFARMRSEACVPDSFTLVAALKACSLLGALDTGRQIHAEICTRTQLDVVLVTSLVSFYAKCGCLPEAHNVFDMYPTRRNETTWNALLSGYSRSGDDKAAFQLFQGMQDAGFHPDGVTFLCILTCCSHAGLVEKASELFETMHTRYGIVRTVEHYGCMIDILGRSNKVEDALALLQSMPCKPSALTWMSLLGACRKWKNVGIGSLAFTSLMKLDCKNAAAYVLMAHIYGSRGMWVEQEAVLAMRKKFKAWKEPGRSCWTNEAGEIHTFLVGDTKETCGPATTCSRLGVTSESSVYPSWIL